MTSNGGFSVGYRKPPRTNRFAKGRSGNPKGRPKGSKNFTTIIQSELAARVDVTENGKRRKITKREAVAKQLVNKAAAGDPKALPLLLNETRPIEGPFATTPAQAETFDQDERAVIANIIERILRADREARVSTEQGRDTAHTNNQPDRENNKP